MKKFSRTIFGLLASAMLVAGSVSFVSCSDDDEEETTQTVEEETTQTVEVETTTNTVTINGTAYTYTTVDGKVQTSDSVTVSDDGTIKITAEDGSYVTIKGTAITYTNVEGKSSSGTLGTESVTLSGDAGEISATSTSETKTETKTTSGSETSLSGNTYVTYTLSDSKAQIHAIAFSNGSGKFVKLTSKDGKDNEFDPETGSYTVSGSDILVEGEKLAVINSDGTITDTEDRTYEKYTCDVYAYTSYSSNETKVEILNLGSDGKGYVFDDKIKNGNAKGKEGTDFTYTKSGNSITITISAGGETMTATGTFSTGTQSGVSVEKLSVSWGEGDVVEYIKLN